MRAGSPSEPEAWKDAVPSYLQFVLWVGLLVIQSFVLCFGLCCGNIQRFWSVYLYFSLASIIGFARFWTLQYFGFVSEQYVYVYYYSDVILALGLFVPAVKLWGDVFEFESSNGIPLRIAAAVLFGTVFITFITVHNTRYFISYVVEFSQNLSIAILGLMTILWVATLAKKLRASAEVRLVWVLLIYFAFYGAAAISRNFGHSEYQEFLLPEVAGLWLVVGAAFVVLPDGPKRV